MRQYILVLSLLLAPLAARADELEDANTALGLCLGDKNAVFDDGISDASTIADAILGACITESERSAAAVYEKVKDTEGVEFDVFKLQMHSFHKNFVLQKVLERRAKKRNGGK